MGFEIDTVLLMTHTLGVSRFVLSSTRKARPLGARVCEALLRLQNETNEVSNQSIVGQSALLNTHPLAYHQSASAFTLL